MRDKVKIIASGKTASGFEIVAKLAVGADLCAAARTMMLALGCIQSQACNTNECPTGIATQDPGRGKALNIKHRHQRVANFQRHTLNSAFEMIGAMGLDDPDKLFPHLIWRRGADETNRHFDEIYHAIEANALLSDQIPEAYAADWSLASADTFAPQL